MKYLEGGRVNIWRFDFPLSVILLNFFVPLFFQPPPSFLSILCYAAGGGVFGVA